MNKNAKKVNPYEKKRKRSLKITRKQWAAIISLVSVIALLAGIIVAINLRDNGEHYEGDGHNHGTANNEHYEGDGHDHGSTPSTGAGNGHGHGSTPSTGSNASGTDKVKYHLYTNEDKTYRLVFRDNAGKTVAEFDKIAKQPTPVAINADSGVYELGWATGSGANDFACIYYNVKTGQVSDKFLAPRGCDGVRVAYGSEDQTKVIVQDLFDKKVYYKEHTLENAYTKAEDIIIGGKLQVDKKTVVISYVSDEKGTNSHASINLYA